MLHTLAAHWWMLLIRGLCAIAFGLMTFAWPALTLLILILLFAIHAVIDGIAEIWLGFRMKKMAPELPGGAMILAGVVTLIAGVLAFVWPGLTALALLYVMAAWAIMRGVLEIAAAIRLRKVIDNEWCLGLAGATSIVFGILLIAWPAAGLLSLAWLIGAAAMAFGILQVLLSFRLRGLRSLLQQPATIAEA